MLVLVEEDHSDTATVTAVNELHAPTTGTVVVHAPYDCPRREFAIEVLNALGRPPQFDEPIATLIGWATSWLLAASPRCDLIVYGAGRVAPDTRRWITELAENDHITVWAVSSPDERLVSAWTGAAAWHWATFISRPWRQERLRRSAPKTLCGAPVPPDWGPDDLPPFPWTRQRIDELATGSPEYAAVLQLTLTYESSLEVVHRLLGGPRIEARGVLAAVAYLALISDSGPDLSVLLRHLEEDVFVRGGLLIVDPHKVTERIAELHADQRLGMGRRTGTEHDTNPDPRRGVGLLISQLRRAERDAFDASANVVAADDGSTLVAGCGSTVHVPPWWRWTVRAAAVSERETSPPNPRTPTLTDRSCLTSYSAISYREPSGDVHAALGPIIDAITPNARFHRLTPDATKHPGTPTARMPMTDSTTQPPLTAAAAQKVHELYELRAERMTHHDRIADDDPGLIWLVEHGLVHYNAAALPEMAPWLFDLMRRRLSGQINPEVRLRRRFV